jgi:nucleotide-binding universal stress UspA family protein
MLKTLVPVDGSGNSDRAVQFLMKQAGNSKEPFEIHLLNVQHPFPGTITGVGDQARQYHHDEGIKALASARQLLDDAKVAYTYHIGVGEVGEVVAHFVSDLKCEQVVMGTRGMSSVANLVLGSGANKVLHLVDVPVLLVK